VKTLSAAVHRRLLHSQYPFKEVLEYKRVHFCSRSDEFYENINRSVKAYTFNVNAVCQMRQTKSFRRCLYSMFTRCYRCLAWQVFSSQIILITKRTGRAATAKQCKPRNIERLLNETRCYVWSVYRARRCCKCCPPVIDWLPLFSLIVLKHIFGIRFKLVMTSVNIGKAQNVVRNESLKNYFFVVLLNFNLITRTIVTFEIKNVFP
jgi:hypothetical protein